MKKTAKNKGFTMVEVTIMMAVLGIIAVLSLPNLKGLITRYRFNSTVSTLATELSLTRSKAVSRNREFRVRIDKNSDVYYIDQGNKSDSSTSWASEGSASAPEGVDIYNVESLTGDTVVYETDGSVDDPDVGYIYFSGVGGTFKKRVKVIAYNGRNVIERWTGAGWKAEVY